MNVQVVTFDSWSDSYGNRMAQGRPGMLVSIEGKTKLIPIMSNNDAEMHKTDALYKVTTNKFGIKRDSFLAFGFEVDWNRRARRGVIRRSVTIDADELLTKRANYHTNGGQVCGSPY